MKKIKNSQKKSEKGIDISKKKSIIYMLPTGQPICESGGTGRRARLRGVWLHRTGSSPVSRTKTKKDGKSRPFWFSYGLPDAGPLQFAELECFALSFTWVRTAYMRKARFHKSCFSHQNLQLHRRVKYKNQGAISSVLR